MLQSSWGPTLSSIISFNDDSLNRHGVSQAEALEVLADDLTKAMDFGESKNGNPTVMYVGYTKKERLLEVGVEFLESAEHIYHARVATRNYVRAYRQKGK